MIPGVYFDESHLNHGGGRRPTAGCGTSFTFNIPNYQIFSLSPFCLLSVCNFVVGGDSRGLFLKLILRIPTPSRKCIDPGNDPLDCLGQSNSEQMQVTAFERFQTFRQIDDQVLLNCSIDLQIAQPDHRQARRGDSGRTGANA